VNDRPGGAAAPPRVRAGAGAAPALRPYDPATLPRSTAPLFASAAEYATQVAGLLFELLVDVLRVRRPEV
jgi:hypothetical protein